MIAAFKPASAIVPESLDATRWSNLEPYYRELIDREIHCAQCLERLILDRSELDAAAAQAFAVLTIRMTCHTDDPEANRAYTDFVENIQPRLREAGFALDRKIISAPQAAELDRYRYEVLLRDLRANVETFRAENVPLETEVARMSQDYTRICGGMTVVFRGEERTLPQLARYNEETDRSVREQAWLAGAARRFQDAQALDDLYERMVQIRHLVAQNAGFRNFRDYAFTSKKRFDYTPQTCHDFARAIREVCTPLLRRLMARRASELGVGSLRPWDSQVDVRGRPPLRPFRDAHELVERSARLFRRIDPAFGEMFDFLRDDPHRPHDNGELARSLDLESRKGKAPGGYQSSRDRIRKPFIFMNATGVQRDVETLLHEGGHAFHALLARAEPILAYRSETPLEFAEVASMSMELLAHDMLEEFYSTEDADRARRMHLEQMLQGLTFIAIVDQFQHWIYEHPLHTRAQRHDYWVSLVNEYGPGYDWTGLDEYLRTGWQRILHLYEVPFYYIEYGIAQLGAIQVWSNHRRDPRGAVESYKKALSLGGSRPLPELFQACGANFDFGPVAVRRLLGVVEDELQRLPG